MMVKGGGGVSGRVRKVRSRLKVFTDVVKQLLFLPAAFPVMH